MRCQRELQTSPAVTTTTWAVILLPDFERQAGVRQQRDGGQLPNIYVEMFVCPERCD